MFSIIIAVLLSTIGYTLYTGYTHKGVVHAPKKFIGAVFFLAAIGMIIPSSDKTETAPVVKTEEQVKAEALSDLRNNQLYNLKKVIKQTAKDSSSLKFDNEKTYKNGVCVDVNGKNSFGGYTGFQTYCVLEKGSKTVFTIDGEIQ